MAKAISQSDVFLSQQENKKVDPVFQEILAKHSNTPSGKSSVIFKMRNAPNGKVHVDGIDDVYDEETKGMRRMRLLRGISEIWQDKQDKIDKSYIDKNRISLTFVQGSLICDSVKDDAIIQFTRRSNTFEGNPHRLPGKKRAIYEWNPAEQEKAAFEKEMLEIEVMQLAIEQPIEKVKKHGYYLGISFVDEMGEPRTEKGIRALYVRAAKADPKGFKESLDSKDVEFKYLIRRAIIEAKIDVSTKNIKWATGGVICKLPHEREATDYLVEFAQLPTDESKEFVDRLQKIAL